MFSASNEYRAVALHRYIVTSACDQQTTILLSLDISAAFDSISYRILFDRLHHDFGIRGTALSWLRSFVSNRKEFVAVGAQQSSSTNCTSDVPQGSVLGPFNP